MEKCLNKNVSKDFNKISKIWNNARFAFSVDELESVYKIYKKLVCSYDLNCLSNDQKYSMACFFKYYPQHKECDLKIAEMLFKNSIQCILNPTIYDIKEYLPYLNYIEKSDNPKILLAVAKIYDNSYNYEFSYQESTTLRNEEKALNIYKLAFDKFASENDYDGMIECCRLIALNLIESGDIFEGISWLKKGMSYDQIELQEGLCQVTLGNLYLDDEILCKDINKAFEYYSLGYSFGNQIAAEQYFYGYDVTQDYKKALEHINKISAESGRMSMFQKGYCNYKLGNYSEARNIFEEGANSSSLDSNECEIGLALIDINSDDEIKAEAIDILENYVTQYIFRGNRLKNNDTYYEHSLTCFEEVLKALIANFDPSNEKYYYYKQLYLKFNDTLLDDEDE